MMMTDLANNRVVVLISANAEWTVIRDYYPNATVQSSKLGEWFQLNLLVEENLEPVIFFHGGWGKIAAAASTQYVIDHWQPDLLVNLGTCGGFEGAIETGEILLADRTVVYDIVEQMGDSAAAIEHYATTLDLAWLREPFPISGAKPVRRSLLVSADKDLIAKEISYLQNEYNAIAGDWESGAIAYVASQNQVLDFKRCERFGWK